MEDQNATIRGLENMLSNYAKRLHQQRHEDVVEAVLETQYKLEVECVTLDPSYAIAFAATSCTYSSKSEARERAYEDRIEILNMQREEEEEHKQLLELQRQQEVSIRSPNGPPAGKDCFNPLAGISMLFTPPLIISDWRKTVRYSI